MDCELGGVCAKDICFGACANILTRIWGSAGLIKLTDVSCNYNGFTTFIMPV